MRKAVQQLEVRTTDNGEIAIEQDDGQAESSGVFITADQVPILIEWLQEAVAELKKQG